MTEKLRLIFTQPRTTEPIVCRMAKNFDIEFSIRRAEIQPSAGWMDLSLDGAPDEVQRAIAWLVEQGIRVTPAGGDVVEG